MDALMHARHPQRRSEPACGAAGELAAHADQVTCPMCRDKLLHGLAVVGAEDRLRHGWARGGDRRAAYHDRPRRQDTSTARRLEALPDDGLDFSMMPPATPPPPPPRAPRRDPVREFLVSVQDIVVGAKPALRAYDRRRR